MIIISNVDVLLEKYKHKIRLFKNKSLRKKYLLKNILK